MKVLSFGSLNYDHFYEVDHFVLPKETMSSLAYRRGYGGKGLNQSIAMAKAGLKVYHAGRVGYDGQDFIDYLKGYGVNTDYLVKDENVATGHAIIEVCNGENRIILFGGANQEVSPSQIDETLKFFDEGDLLLIQNEISSISYLMDRAKEKGLITAFNTAPFNEKVYTYPLDKTDIFIVNEVEAKGLSGCESDDLLRIAEALKDKFPGKEIIMTAGSEGSYYIKDDILIHQDIYKVKAVDTTSAGDTFTGFFLASYLKDKDVKKALDLASRASSITVSRKGSSSSIPSIEELQ